MAGPFDFAPPTYSADTLRSIDNQNASRGFVSPSVQNLQQEAPETLVAPKREQFNNDANFQAAQTRFNTRGDWATNPEDYYSAGDKASVAKYGTPLPPNDPASMNGGRQAAGDLYIGRENWNTLQQKYTPYQLERATQRDANGNISWRKDVDISKIPASGAGTPMTPPTVGTPSATDVVAGSGPSTASMTGNGNSFDTSAALSASAQKYLSGIDLALDNITKQQQAITEREKATAEAGRTGAIDKIKGFFNSTSNTDALNAAREKYEVDQNFATLQDIRTKIATATGALEQGLIYEQDRPVRMAAMQGRTATLQKQGQATIGALKMGAEIVQGNLDYARMYADDTLAALKQDNLDQMNAADTLLNLYNDDLVRLDEKETEQLNYRKKLLEDENDRLEKGKDQIFSLAEQYPQSFTKAGVTFLDTPEQAMQKMLPLLSERERMELEQKKLSLDSARLSNTKKSSGGGGSGGGGSTGFAPGTIQSEIAEKIAYYTAADGLGLSASEARKKVFGEYGGQLKTTELTSIVDNVLQGSEKAMTPEEQAIADGKAIYGFDSNQKWGLMPAPEKPIEVKMPTEDTISKYLPFFKKK